MLRLLALLFLLSPPAAAQLADLRPEGRVELYTATRAGGDADYLALRARARLGLTASYDGGELYAESQWTYNGLRDADPLSEAVAVDLRFAWIDVFFDALDLRIGRQPLVWGQADGAFVTDVLMPLDLSEFLAQDPEDLRLGVVAARATAFLGDFELDGVWMPRTPVSVLPDADSPWNVLPDAVLGIPVVFGEAVRDAPTLAGSEGAVRVTWQGLPLTDVALLGVYAANRLPTFRKALTLGLRNDPDDAPLGLAFTATPVYERRALLGATFETTLADPVVLRGEVAFEFDALIDEALPADSAALVQGIQDETLQASIDRGFLTTRSGFQAALAAERGFGNQTLRLQGLVRHVFDHDETLVVDPWEGAATAIWVGRFRRDLLTLRLFATVETTGSYWLNPQFDYALRDALTVRLGGQVFGGPQPDDTTVLAGLRRAQRLSFATYDANDLVFVQVIYGF
ncbi:MAG: DUF1302 family protein [Bacteroidota bacterium]